MRLCLLFLRELWVHYLIWVLKRSPGYEREAFVYHPVEQEKLGFVVFFREQG